MVNKKSLSERDICTKYINPALAKAGWNIKTKIREEVFFTDGRIIVQGKMHTRGKRKRADYILFYKPFPERKAKVETINRFMVLCDQLEQKVQQSEQQVELVMKGVLREVLG